MKFSEACESLLQTFIESLLSPLHHGRLRVSTESAYKIENCSDSVVLYPAVQDFFFHNQNQTAAIGLSQRISDGRSVRIL